MFGQDLFKGNPGVNGRPYLTSHFDQALNKAAQVVRFILASIFFWFGILKLAGVSPMIEMLRHSIPVMAESPFVQLLALAEICVAFGLVNDRLSRPASSLMMLNLVCALGVVALAPALVFAEDAPGLTAQGSFLANYVCFTLAGLTILGWRQRSARNFRSSSVPRYRGTCSRSLY